MTPQKSSARVASAVHTLARRHCACGPHSGRPSNPESGGVQQCARVTFPAHPLSRSHACHRFVTYTSMSYDVVVSFDCGAGGQAASAAVPPPRRATAQACVARSFQHRPAAPPSPKPTKIPSLKAPWSPPGRSALRGNGSASEKGPSGPKEAKVKVTHVGGPSVVCGACAGRRARRDVSKGVRSAHTQAALTGARTTPSARADANGRKEDEPPKRCTRLLNVAAARPSIGAVGACAPSELRVHHHVDSTRIRSVTS